MALSDNPYYHIVEVFGRDVAEDLLLIATNEIREPEEQVKELSCKAEKIKRHLEILMSANAGLATTLSQIVSELLEENVVVDKKIRNIKFKPWAVCVQMTDMGNGVIPGRPYIMMWSQKGYIKLISNSFQITEWIATDARNIRPATNGEIKGFVNGIFDNNPSKLNDEEPEDEGF